MDDALLIRNSAIAHQDSKYSNLASADIMIAAAGALPINITKEVIPNTLLLHDANLEYIIHLSPYNFGSDDQPIYKLNYSNVTVGDALPAGLTVNGDILVTHNRAAAPPPIIHVADKKLITIAQLQLFAGDAIEIRVPVKFSMQEFKTSLP